LLYLGTSNILAKTVEEAVLEQALLDLLDYCQVTSEALEHIARGPDLGGR